MKAYIHKITASDALDCDLKAIVRNPLMRRRMSRIVRDGVMAAALCAEGYRVDAIITATAYGCLADSEKFLRTWLESDEELLSPTPFIQSTFNTVGATIALLGRNHCYNTTYAHGDDSFASALLDALMLISEGEAQHILVGAVEELTPTLCTLLRRMRVEPLPEQGGALFFLISKTAEEARAEICLESVGTTAQDRYRDPLAPARALYNAIINKHSGTLAIGNLNLSVRCI